MAKNYDNYGYEDDYRDNRSSIIRKILIIIMVVIAILLIIVLIKGCNSKKVYNDINKVVTFDYEGKILDAGKTYFELHLDENPNAIGECSIVELQSLIEARLVDADKFGNCNVTTSYVRVCMLENGQKHYTPWLTCVNKKSEDEYVSSKMGTLSDVVVDKSYVEFKFIPYSYNGNGSLGKVEELWKDEITYDKYKTLKTTKYYRYRDKLFIWDLAKRTYYSSTGEKNSEAETNEYYTTSPNSLYRLSSSKTTEAYKWYKSSATKEYYMVNGAKYPSPTAIGEYTLHDPVGIDVTRYRTRTVTGTYSPTKYYVCSTSASSPVLKYQLVRCGTGVSPEFNYQREIIYSCTGSNSSSDLIRANQVSGPNSVCKSYSEWSNPTSTPCNTSNTDICYKITVTFYYWYKNINEKRTYYPSMTSKASSEKVYYIEAPIKGAIKDTSTRTTAYKWYKETKTTTDKYLAIPPNGYNVIKKSSSYQWTEWSNWMTKNPKVSDGRERKIETKVKLKIQELKDDLTSGWNKLNEGYLSEEELIKLYKDKGYKVNTLEDITNNGELKYDVILFVRNKKESY